MDTYEYLNYISVWSTKDLKTQIFMGTNRSNLQSRAPLVLQNVQANAAQAINIGVINLGDEANLEG